MGITCPVSEKIVGYLLSSPGDALYAELCAFEFYYDASEDRNHKNMEAIVSITRCTDNPDNFLIGNLKNFEVIDEGGVQKYRYEVRPVRGLVEFLGFKAKDGALRIYDEVHIGPYDCEETLKILELMHACHRELKEREKAAALRSSLTEKSGAAFAGKANPKGYSVEGDVIRPTRWGDGPPLS